MFSFFLNSPPSLFLFALKSWLVTPDLPWCCSKWPVVVVELCLQTLWAGLGCLFNSISRRMLWTTNQQWPPLDGDKLLVDEDVLGLLRKCYWRFSFLCCMRRCANSLERTACTKWPLRSGKVLLWPKDSSVWKQDSAAVEHGTERRPSWMGEIFHWLWCVVLHASEMMCWSPCLHEESRNVRCKVGKESQWILHLAFHTTATEACLYSLLRNRQWWDMWQRHLLWYVSYCG